MMIILLFEFKFGILEGLEFREEIVIVLVIVFVFFCVMIFWYFLLIDSFIGGIFGEFFRDLD